MRKAFWKRGLSLLLGVVLLALPACGGKDPEVTFGFEALRGTTSIAGAELQRGVAESLPEELEDTQDVLHLRISTNGLEGNTMQATKEQSEEIYGGTAILYRGERYPLQTLLGSYTAGKGIEHYTLVFYVPLDTSPADCTLWLSDSQGEREYPIIQS